MVTRVKNAATKSPDESKLGLEMLCKMFKKNNSKNLAFKKTKKLIQVKPVGVLDEITYQTCWKFGINKIDRSTLILETSIGQTAYSDRVTDATNLTIVAFLISLTH
mgnify:CR=1 FL=1